MRTRGRVGDRKRGKTQKAREKKGEIGRWIGGQIERERASGGREHGDVARRFISIILYFSQT